jgi:AcrR family transcriptional regulator
MVIKQRAIQDEDKLVRRQAILSAAAAEFVEHPYRLAAVEEVARRAGLAKGTVYLYFASKEEIYLAVHDRNSHRFFDALEELLASERPRLGLKRFARIVVEALKRSPAHLPLAVQCPSLEANVDGEALARCRAGIGERLQRIGAMVEGMYPALKRGEGVRLLTRSYALILGLWQLMVPGSANGPPVDQGASAACQLDFMVQIEAGLVVLWRGTVAA